MIVRIEQKHEIENPRHYPTVIVEDLRALLMAGAVARLDPRRAHFFEVDGNRDTFFLHISPVTGKVMLVAKWLRAACEEYVSAGAADECVDLSECC